MKLCFSDADGANEVKEVFKNYFIAFYKTYIMQTYTYIWYLLLSTQSYTL